MPNKVQSGRFLGLLFKPLLKDNLHLMKNILQPLAKSVLIPLGLAAQASDTVILKRTFRSGIRSSNEKMDDIIKSLSKNTAYFGNFWYFIFNLSNFCIDISFNN